MEEYRILKEYPKYQISNTGNVQSIKSKRILKLYKDSTGYNSICIYKTKLRVHRLVGKTWLDNPNQYNVIDHIDRNRLNNSFDNLRWCSVKTNTINKNKKINSISSYKGITYDKIKSKWRPYISINGKTKFLGRFNTEEEAHDFKVKYVIDNNISKDYL